MGDLVNKLRIDIISTFKFYPITNIDPPPEGSVYGKYQLYKLCTHQSYTFCRVNT